MYSFSSLFMHRYVDVRTHIFICGWRHSNTHTGSSYMCVITRITNVDSFTICLHRQPMWFLLEILVHSFGAFLIKSTSACFPLPFLPLFWKVMVDEHNSTQYANCINMLLLKLSNLECLWASPAIKILWNC